ncbi:MAG: nucleotidyltransferase family protein [Litorimonas sp.]
MSVLETAMVMAAGHGTRMKPLTDDRAKAMVELGGQPLIGHMLSRLVAVGVKRVIVNVHAHADHLEDYLNAQPYDLDIIISDERQVLLETGGGVVKALPLLGNAPILICNIDAIWAEFSAVLPKLIGAWNPENMDELFLLARRDAALGYDGKGDFDMADTGQISRRNAEYAPYIYAGVEIFKPHLAKPFKVEKFSRNIIWNETLKRRRVYGIELAGYWMHVGDPRARRAAQAVLQQVKHDNAARQL